MGCTESEWLGWLPAAIGEHTWSRHDASVEVLIHDNNATALGRLQIHWVVEPARKIALIRMPRLRVHFAFEGLDEAQRYRFMRRFDLYMHRGGG